MQPRIKLIAQTPKLLQTTLNRPRINFPKTNHHHTPLPPIITPQPPLERLQIKTPDIDGGTKIDDVRTTNPDYRRRFRNTSMRHRAQYFHLNSHPTRQTMLSNAPPFARRQFPRSMQDGVDSVFATDGEGLDVGTGGAGCEGVSCEAGGREREE